MRRSMRALAAMTVAASGLAGCLLPGGSHLASETVHDNDLTFDDYDGTTDYDAPPGGTLAQPPVEVHEFDTNQVQSAGAIKVIDGQKWLNAGDYERNTLLLGVEKAMPPGATLVLVVATGEVWVIPLGSTGLIVAGAIREWKGSEYDQLDEYVGEQYKSKKILTFAAYQAIAAIQPSIDLGTVYTIHDLGPVGLKEIETAHGYQIMLHQTWISATPEWRTLHLEAIEHFNEKLPAFQGEGNRPVFGVSIPWGNVYVVPENNYKNLIQGGAIKPWNPEQIGNLPAVKPDHDPTIRGVSPFEVHLDLKF